MNYKAKPLLFTKKSVILLIEKDKDNEQSTSKRKRERS